MRNKLSYLATLLVLIVEAASAKVALLPMQEIVNLSDQIVVGYK